MTLNKEMLDFKPKLQKNFIQYIREDKKNSYTVKLKINSNNERIVNKSFLNIVNEFNGENTVEKIIEKICSSFKKVEKEVVSNDVVSTLYNIIEMKGLELVDNNPFINRFKSKINENTEIYIAQYSDVKKISPLINDVYNITKVNQYTIYNNPYIYDEEIDYFKEIYESNDNNEVIFVISNNNLITGLIIYSIYNNNVITLKHAILPNQDTNTYLYFKKTLTATVKAINEKPKCIRVYFEEFDNGYINESLKYMGFEESAYLKNELGKNLNLIEMSYYI